MYFRESGQNLGTILYLVKVPGGWINSCICPTLSKFRAWKPGIWLLYAVALSTSPLSDTGSVFSVSQGDAATLKAGLKDKHCISYCNKKCFHLKRFKMILLSGSGGSQRRFSLFQSCPSLVLPDN